MEREKAECKVEREVKRSGMRNWREKVYEKVDRVIGDGKSSHIVRRERV